MSVTEEIKKEMKNLVDEQLTLLKLAAKNKDLLDFGTAYQNWYTRALRIVGGLAPERLAEFIGYYQIDPKRKRLSSTTYVIQDYIMGRAADKSWNDKPVWNINDTVRIRFSNQVQILEALSTRVDSVLSDVTGSLFAELQDHELNAARDLLAVSVRAAGALAGVILERHLQQMARNRNMVVKKTSPTITDLNDPLKKAEAYDTPTWRKIQLLGDIRNLCSHQKSADPTKDQVEELISGVNMIVKTVF